MLSKTVGAANASYASEATTAQRVVDGASVPGFELIVDLDVVAVAITSDLLQPYIAPQRPMLLGTSATHYMRASYTPRVELDPAACVRAQHHLAAADAVVHRDVAALGHAIANALGTTLLTGIDWADTGRSDADVATWHNAVVLCADALSQTVDPSVLVSFLARIQRHAAVLVISVPLREFTMSVDNVGPPSRGDRLREWAFPEMQALLDSAGLDAVFGGLVPRTAETPGGQTGVFVAIRGIGDG